MRSRVSCPSFEAGLELRASRLHPFGHHIALPRKWLAESSPVVLLLPMQEAWGSVLGQGTRSQMLQLKSSHATTKTQHSQINK